MAFSVMAFDGQGLLAIIALPSLTSLGLTREQSKNSVTRSRSQSIFYYNEKIMRLINNTASTLFPGLHKPLLYHYAYSRNPLPLRLDHSQCRYRGSFNYAEFFAGLIMMIGSHGLSNSENIIRYPLALGINRIRQKCHKFKYCTDIFSFSD